MKPLIVNNSFLEKKEPSSEFLRVANVSKSFANKSGKINALEGVSFQVFPGEFVCLLGPSGCGKSTLLNLIAGLDNVTTGSIKINGQEVVGTDSDRIVIFQEGGLFPWLTVRQNVEFGLKIKKLKQQEINKRVSETIEMVGLSKFIDAYPHQLSGGMKQRAAIARGLVLDPKVLLMDEPFAALDAQTRDRLHVELQQIWRATKKTILFVTHNVREAACLADRILLFSPHPGRLYKEYHVDLQRPRTIEDKAVMEIVRTIQSDLKMVVNNHSESENAA